MVCVYKCMWYMGDVYCVLYMCGVCSISSVCVVYVCVVYAVCVYVVSVYVCVVVCVCGVCVWYM